MSLLLAHKFPPPLFLSFPFPLLLTSHRFTILSFQAMLLSQEPPLFHFQFPLSEVTFTPTEIHELLSLFDSDFPANSASGSEAGRRVYSDEERKRRRTISNRESARRSRWRKKKHLENMTGEMNRLRMENRELKNRLCLALQQCHIAQRENGKLETQRFLLQQRLSYLCQNLLSMHPGQH